MDRKLSDVLAQGRKIMSANAQVVAFLEKLDAYTSDLAEQQAKQTAKIAEIAADIDALIAGGSDLPADTLTRLQAASDGLAATVAFETAQAETLTQIAAKNDNPLPPAKPKAKK
jgi:hypothetical protein